MDPLVSYGIAVSVVLLVIASVTIGASLLLEFICLALEHKDEQDGR
jgi:hypothetical protein